MISDLRNMSLLHEGSNNLRQGENPEEVARHFKDIAEFVAQSIHHRFTRLIMCSLVPSPATEPSSHNSFIQLNKIIHDLVKQHTFCEFSNLSKVFWWTSHADKIDVNCGTG